MTSDSTRRRRAQFKRADVTRLLLAYRDAGQPAPKIVIELDRITAVPAGGEGNEADPNPWDQK